MKITGKIKIFPRMYFTQPTKVREDKRKINRSTTKIKLKKHES
jgi:hypothetical protein